MSILKRRILVCLLFPVLSMIIIYLSLTYAFLFFINNMVGLFDDLISESKESWIE